MEEIMNNRLVPQSQKIKRSEPPALLSIKKEIPLESQFMKGNINSSQQIQHQQNSTMIKQEGTQLSIIIILI